MTSHIYDDIVECIIRVMVGAPLKENGENGLAMPKMPIITIMVVH